MNKKLVSSLLAFGATAMMFGAIAVLAMPAPARAAEVGGIKFDDQVTLEGKKLELNGLGIRQRAMFKVYAMGLYLPRKVSSTEAVLASQGPRRIQLVMMRDVSGEDFGQAFMSGISANTDKAEKAKLMNQMVKFGETFVTVGSLKKGDVVLADWAPGKGLLMMLNGKAIGEPIAEQAFYDALLKIWLGDKPADGSLKPLLLGAKPTEVAQGTN
jgi:hypothetical protein